MAKRLISVVLAAVAAVAAFAVAPGAGTAATTGSISGTAREAGTGTPLGGLDVTIVQVQKVVVFGRHTTATVPIAYGVTNDDGTYTVDGLAPDPGYYVCFSEGFFGFPHLGNCYLDAEIYNPLPNPFGWVQVGTDSARVRVMAGQQVTRIDAQLRIFPFEQYGFVSGTVTQRYVGSALRNVRVTAYDATNTVVDEALTQAGGKYNLYGLLGSASGYRICFDGSAATGGVTLHAYGRVCYPSRVSVTPGATTPNVNAALTATV